MGIDEVLDAREGDDLVEVTLGLGLRQPQDRRIEVDILPSRQVRVESRTELQESGQAAS